MDDNSFEEVLQHLVHVRNTENSVLKGQITELRAAMADYERQLRHSERERKKQSDSLCSMKDKVKRARAKIALQGLENRQLKRLLAQHGIPVPSSQSVLNSSLPQHNDCDKTTHVVSSPSTSSCSGSSTSQCVPPVPPVTVVCQKIPHGCAKNTMVSPRKNMSLQLRKRKKNLKNGTSAEPVQGTHSSVVGEPLPSSQQSPAMILETQNKSLTADDVTQAINQSQSRDSTFPETYLTFDLQSEQATDAHNHISRATHMHTPLQRSQVSSPVSSSASETNEFHSDTSSAESNPSSPSLLSQLPVLSTPPHHRPSPPLFQQSTLSTPLHLPLSPFCSPPRSFPFLDLSSTSYNTTTTVKYTCASTDPIIVSSTAAVTVTDNCQQQPATISTSGAGSTLVQEHIPQMKKGFVQQNLFQSIARLASTRSELSSPTAGKETVSSMFPSDIALVNPFMNSTFHRHVVPPTPWHRPIHSSTLSSVLDNEMGLIKVKQRQQKKCQETKNKRLLQEEYESQLSEEVLPSKKPTMEGIMARELTQMNKKIAEKRFNEVKVLEEEENNVKETLDNDFDMTRPLYDHLHTTTEVDNDVTKSMIVPVSSITSDHLNTSTTICHRVLQSHDYNSPVVSQASATSSVSTKESERCQPHVSTTEKSTMLTEAQKLAQRAGLPTYKCSVVIRRKEDRAKLDAHACPECEAWFKGDDGIHRDKKEHLRTICRHKHLHQPPESDPTIWDISFPDE